VGGVEAEVREPQISQITQMNTARIWFSLIVALVVVGCVRSQTLVTECVHRDSTGHVIYLERAYRDADTMVHFMAYSDGGRVLKSSSMVRGDTLIETFRCFYLDPRPLIPKVGFELNMLISEDVDSMVIHVLGDDGKTAWDTALTHAQGDVLMELDQKMRSDMASLVYAGELNLDMNLADLRETWEYRSLRGGLIDLRVKNGSGTTTNRQYFNYSYDALTALSYFNQDTVAYGVDSISWAPDSTFMRVVNCGIDNSHRYEYTVRCLGDSSVFISREKTVVDHWVYDRTPWNVRLREAALREGPLCQSRIVRAGESLLKSSDASTGNYSRSEHLWLPDGRLLETVVSRNGRFDRRITYSYP
jgi:hypothetical protein